MPYCTIAHVKDHLSGWLELSESTKPTLAAAIAEIDLVSAQVSVALAMGETTLPVTDADLLLDLQRLVSRETAYQCRAMAGVVLEASKDPLWVTWHEEFLAAIEQMKLGTFTATGLTDYGSPSSFTMDAEENPDITDIQPAITRGKKF